jgi:hypothetical protein
MGKLWEKLGSQGSLCYESFRRHGAAAWIRISLKRWCSCCSAASHGRSHLFVPFTIHLRNFRGEVSEKSFLVVRTSLSLAITLRKEGRVGLLGETPNGLSASTTLQTGTRNVNTGFGESPIPVPETPSAFRPKYVCPWPL